MSDYQCHVSIDVEAASPQDAAKQAERYLRDPECRGWVVHVATPGQPAMLIDNAGELAEKILPLPPELSDRELATVLAALRNFQPLVENEQSRGELRESMEHFDGVDPLTADEIDALCERLNVKQAPACPQGWDYV